jgi:hypothetical protein
MTDLLKKAIDAVSTLPDEDQDRIAALMMNEAQTTELSDCRRSWISGKKPSREQVREAVEGLKAMSQNLTLGGLSIRELIDEGRH